MQGHLYNALLENDAWVVLLVDVVKDNPQAVPLSSDPSQSMYQWEVTGRGGCPKSTNDDTLAALSNTTTGRVTLSAAGSSE